MNKTLSEAIKQQVAANQCYECANSPGKILRGLKDFNCPLWELEGRLQGRFRKSGYQIDHIIERSIGVHIQKITYKHYVLNAEL